MPPTMLPAILSEQLNGGQSQPRNELMYQRRNLLRTTTSKWVVLICWINLCSHREFALGQRNDGDIEISLQSYWHFHELLKAMWSLILKITSFWKTRQNIVAVNSVVVDQSVYARNAMLPYTLTLSRTIIHETQNLLYCFLPEVIII